MVERLQRSVSKIAAIDFPIAFTKVIYQPIADAPFTPSYYTSTIYHVYVVHIKSDHLQPFPSSNLALDPSKTAHNYPGEPGRYRGSRYACVVLRQLVSFTIA